MLPTRGGSADVRSVGTLVMLGAPGGAEAVCEPQAPTSLVRHGQLSTALVRGAAATAIWATEG